MLLTFQLNQVAQGLVQLSFEYADDGDSTASLGAWDNNHDLLAYSFLLS